MARFDRLTVYQTLLDQAMLPLFYHPDFTTSQQVTSALARAGGRVLEFTNRGDFALEVFGQLVKYCAQHHPDLIIGVGTIEDPATAALFAAHGANFIVSPYFDEATARFCNQRKLPYLPGCGTVKEIAHAETWGAEIIKLFPGEAVGGPQFIKDVLGPRPWSRLMPSGGVRPEEANLRQWLTAGAACLGMGSQLIRKEWVQNADWDAIQQATQSALTTIQSIRAAL